MLAYRPEKHRVVFTTYLAIGFGAMTLLRLASFVRILGFELFGTMGAGYLVLAGISLLTGLPARPAGTAKRYNAYPIQ
jgi:hypothetical protein